MDPTTADFTVEQVSYLLTDRSGVASHFHALLCATNQKHQASYYRDTVQVWNPADDLYKSFLSTSAAFYSDRIKSLYKFHDKPIKQFKKISIKIFHDWYIDLLRKQSRRYQQHIANISIDFTNQSIIDNLTYKDNIMSNNNPYDVTDRTYEARSIFQLVGEFLEFHATARERFIYLHMIGLEDLIYDKDYRYTLNYPGEKLVTRQTFHNHKKKFLHKLKGLTLKAKELPRPPVPKIKSFTRPGQAGANHWRNKPENAGAKGIKEYVAEKREREIAEAKAIRKQDLLKVAEKYHIQERFPELIDQAIAALEPNNSSDK